MRHHLVTDFKEAVFGALADPTRRAVLDLLRQHGSLPAGRIAHAFPVSRPAVSKHLRRLSQESTAGTGFTGSTQTRSRPSIPGSAAIGFFGRQASRTSRVL